MFNKGDGKVVEEFKKLRVICDIPSNSSSLVNLDEDHSRNDMPYLSMHDAVSRSLGVCKLTDELQSTHIALAVRYFPDTRKVFFRVDRRRSLRTLMDAYCIQMNMEIDSFRFIFAGKRIKAHQTPYEFEMDDGDEIIAMKLLRSGVCHKNKKPNVQSTHITLKVKNQDDRNVFFRVERSSPLQKLMEDYCNEMGLEMYTSPFLFDGVRIKGHQSPAELEMEDGDEIDVMEHVIGGGFTF